MHDQTGWLVNDEQMRVRMHDVKRHALGHKRARLGRWAQFDLQGISCAHTLRGLAHHSAIEQDRAIGHQLLQITARELGDGIRQDPVQTLPMLQRLYREGARVGASLQQQRIIGVGAGRVARYNQNRFFQEGCAHGWWQIIDA